MGILLLDGEPASEQACYPKIFKALFSPHCSYVAV